MPHTLRSKSLSSVASSVAWLALGFCLLLAPLHGQVILVGNFNGNNVQSYAPNGSSSGTFVTTAGSATGMVKDSVGNVYIATNDTSAIIKYNSSGTNLGTFATAAAAGVFGLAFDTNGNLYAGSIQNNTIEKFNSAGVSQGIFASSNLTNPRGLAVDSGGNVYAANLGSTTVSKFSAAGTFLGAFGTGLASPSGLLFDNAGNLYVTQLGGTSIQMITPGGVQSTFTTAATATGYVALAFDFSGDILAVNHSGSFVEKFSSAGADLGVFTNTGLTQPYFVLGASAVPEPSTYAVILGGMALLGAWVYRRRH